MAVQKPIFKGPLFHTYLKCNWFAIAPHNFQLKKKILLKHRELAKMEAKVKSYLQILYENILEN